MRRVFHSDLLNNYISYGTLRQIKIDLKPIPVAYSNQVHHQLELDLFNPTQRLFLQNNSTGGDHTKQFQSIFQIQNTKEGIKGMIREKYRYVEGCQQFYNCFNEYNNFVDHMLLNRKAVQKQNKLIKSTPILARLGAHRYSASYQVGKIDYNETHRIGLIHKE